MDDDTIPVPLGAEEYVTARRWRPNREAQNDGYVPPGEASIDWAKLPPPKRDNLRLSAWLKLKLPPRDYLLGELLCTTSRWLIIGDQASAKPYSLSNLVGRSQPVPIF